MTQNISSDDERKNKEKKVLGEILILKGLSLVRDMTSDYFVTPQHKVIFEAMQKMNRMEKPLDILGLGRELLENDQLDYIGGFSYITELEQFAISSNQIQQNVRKFMEERNIDSQKTEGST